MARKRKLGLFIICLDNGWEDFWSVSRDEVGLRASKRPIGLVFRRDDETLRYNKNLWLAFCTDSSAADLAYAFAEE